MLLPLSFQEAGNDRIISPEAFSDRAFMAKSELHQELASPTIPLGGQAGDPGAIELVESVREYRRNQAGRQPIRPLTGKTDLNVSPLRLKIMEDHTANEIIVLIRHPKGLAGTEVLDTGNTLRNPLRHQRGEVSHQLQSWPPVWFSYLTLKAMTSTGAFVLRENETAIIPSPS